MCAPTRSRSSGRTSRPTSTPRAAPSASNRRSRRWSSRRTRKRPSTRPRTSRSARQRPPLGQARIPRHHHADPGAAPLLRLRRQRRGPLHDRRPVPPGAALAARTRHAANCPTARANWINPAFIYTHGYGLVLAPVSQITPDGLPVLLIENAPPEVKTTTLKLTRPEIYYGEVTHEPVFVHTAQRGVQLPAGEPNVYSHYEGKGGFPISPLRHAPGGGDPRGRAEHPADQLPDARQPHDDPPQGARPAARNWPASSSGTPTRTW